MDPEIEQTILDVPEEPTGAGLTRDQIAHHEAAHAVLGYRLAGGVDERGIDLEHRSAQGASGGAVCLLLEDAPELTIGERRGNLLRNVMTICAGPACDAKLTGKSLERSLMDQWSDHRNAVRLLNESPIIDRDGGDNGKAEMAYVLKQGLDSASQQLERPETWASIAAVATSVLAAGGKLSGPEIIDVIETSDRK